MLGRGKLSLTAELFLIHDTPQQLSERSESITRTAQHTTASSCYLPCTWLMHRIKPSAAYQVYFKFSSSLPYSIKFLYWGLTLLNYVKKQLYVLYSSEGHSTRMRWSDKTSDTEGWLQIHSVQSHRTVYHCCKSTVKSIVPLLPTSTYFMCNKIL